MSDLVWPQEGLLELVKRLLTGQSSVPPPQPEQSPPSGEYGAIALSPWADSLQRALGVAPSRIESLNDFTLFGGKRGEMAYKGAIGGARPGGPMSWKYDSTIRLHPGDEDADQQRTYAHELGHLQDRVRTIGQDASPLPEAAQRLGGASSAGLSPEEYAELIRLGWQRWSGRIPSFQQAKAVQGVRSPLPFDANQVNKLSDLLAKRYDQNK